MYTFIKRTSKLFWVFLSKHIHDFLTRSVCIIFFHFFSYVVHGRRKTPFSSTPPPHRHQGVPTRGVPVRDTLLHRLRPLQPLDEVRVILLQRQMMQGVIWCTNSVDEPYNKAMQTLDEWLRNLRNLRRWSEIYSLGQDFLWSAAKTKGIFASFLDF